MKPCNILSFQFTPWHKFQSPLPLPTRQVAQVCMPQPRPEGKSGTGACRRYRSGNSGRLSVSERSAAEFPGDRRRRGILVLILGKKVECSTALAYFTRTTSARMVIGGIAHRVKMAALSCHLRSPLTGSDGLTSITATVSNVIPIKIKSAAKMARMRTT